jgi:hypothetical protein
MAPSGTNQMAIAAAWMKNKIISSAYSAWRSVFNTGWKNTCKRGKLKPGTRKTINQCFDAGFCF